MAVNTELDNAIYKKCPVCGAKTTIITMKDAMTGKPVSKDAWCPECHQYNATEML